MWFYIIIFRYIYAYAHGIVPLFQDPEIPIVNVFCWWRSASTKAKAWGVAGKRMPVSKAEKRLDIIGMSLLQPFREAYAGGE